jgi:transposase
MTKAPRGRYSQELRQQAVTMAVEDGFGVAETARRLSVSVKTLANWVTQYRLDKQEFALKPGVSEQDAELARLKKENALLRMERDILKKRRRTLPKSRCEVLRRSQCFATPVFCPIYLPSFARICQWVLRLDQTRCGPIKQGNSSGGRGSGCPQANTGHIRLGAVAPGTLGKWLHRLPLEG